MRTLSPLSYIETFMSIISSTAFSLPVFYSVTYCPNGRPGCDKKVCIIHAICHLFRWFVLGQKISQLLSTLSKFPVVLYKGRRTVFAPVKVVLFKAVGFDACKYCGKHNKIVVTAAVIFLDMYFSFLTCVVFY